MSETRRQETAQLLRLLGHPVQPQTVSALEMQLNIRQPNLSQHLAVLRAAGLLYARREAKSVTYAVSDGLSTRLVAALSALMSEAGPDQTTYQPQQDDEPVYSPRQGDELVFATLRTPNDAGTCRRPEVATSPPDDAVGPSPCGKRVRARFAAACER